MPATQIRRQLATYSLVSQRLDGTADPISAMKPFFAPIAADWHGRRFEPTAFRAELQSRYGLRISGDVTAIFVQRLHGLGMLRPIGSEKFEWVRAAATNDNGSAAEARLDKLLQDAARLHETRKDLLDSVFDGDLFLGGLQSVLLSQNRPLSNAVVAISGATISKSGGDVSGRDSLVQHHEYFAAEYVRWCKENDAPTFEWLSELSASTFVSEALIGIRTPSGSLNPRADVAIYLDTPFAMELLGCSGYSAKEDARFIVDTLKSIGIPVYILQHSVHELQGNLKAVLLSHAWDRRGPTAAAILHQEVTEFYLEDVRNNPQHFLAEIGVKVIDTSKQPQHVCHKSFSEEQNNNFYAKIYSLYENELARHRDALSIQWMMYRRKGVVTSDVLRSKHLLLTRNKNLVRYAQEFALSDCGYRRGQAGPAIGARELAGVLWLLMGQQERIQLSQRQLLLSCDRARAAAPEVVSAMMEAVRGVNPKNADLISAAMRRPAYLAMAMDAVANDGGRISEATIERTLEAVQADLVAVEREQAALRIEEEKQRFDSEAVLQKLVNASLTADRDALAQKLDDARTRQDAANLAAFEKNRRRFGLAGRVSVVVTHLIVVAVAVVAAVAGTDAFALSWPIKAGVATVAALACLYGTHRVVSDQIIRLWNRLGESAYRNEADKIFVSEGEARYLEGPLIS